MPRNYFVGVRLPWTLEDDENWKATNGLAGKIMMLGGMTALPLVLLLPDPAAEIALGVLIAAVVIVPAVFSYRFFRRTKRG